jgi:hypothetical protein
VGALLSIVVNSENVPHPDDKVERARRESSRQLARQVDEDEPGGVPDEETDDGEPRLELQVADSTGTTIRTWKVPVHLGLNRVTWNLRRDAFRQPVTGERTEEGEESRGSGVLVLPGSYTVTARFGEANVSTPVRVVADPRESATAADRLEKYRTLLEAGQTREALADAISLIFRLRSDLTDALQARSRMKDSLAVHATGKDAEAGDELVELADEIRRALKELEERIRVPEGTKGIVYSEDRAWNQINYVLGSLQSSWDAPTPAQIAYLNDARAVTREVLADLQALNEGDVERFRAAIRAANLELMPREKVPELP